MVTNLINKNGNAVKNQFVIYEDNGDVMFQSYKSNCAELRDYGEFDKVLALGTNWDYSNTTLRHLCTFVNDILGTEGINTAKLRKALDVGYMTVGDEQVVVICDKKL